MYACLYILEIWNVKLYDYPELILIFYRLVTSSKPTKYISITRGGEKKEEKLHTCGGALLLVLHNFV